MVSKGVFVSKTTMIRRTRTRKRVSRTTKPTRTTRAVLPRAKRTTAAKPKTKRMVQKRKNNPLIGKVGWCDGKTLGLDTGHYVFIRRVYGDECSVNTFTSLTYPNGSYKIRKFPNVESGQIYPIPRKDTTLPRFSGIHKNTITHVPVSSIRDVGKHTLKRRHHGYIRKHMKK